MILKGLTYLYTKNRESWHGRVPRVCRLWYIRRLLRCLRRAWRGTRTMRRKRPGAWRAPPGGTTPHPPPAASLRQCPPPAPRPHQHPSQLHPGSIPPNPFFARIFPRRAQVQSFFKVPRLKKDELLARSHLFFSSLLILI